MRLNPSPHLALQNLFTWLPNNKVRLACVSGGAACDACGAWMPCPRLCRILYVLFCMFFGLFVRTGPSRVRAGGAKFSRWHPTISPLSPPCYADPLCRVGCLSSGISAGIYDTMHARYPRTHERRIGFCTGARWVRAVERRGYWQGANSMAGVRATEDGLDGQRCRVLWKKLKQRQGRRDEQCHVSEENRACPVKSVGPSFGMPMAKPSASTASVCM